MTVCTVGFGRALNKYLFSRLSCLLGGKFHRVGGVSQYRIISLFYYFLLNCTYSSYYLKQNLIRVIISRLFLFNVHSITFSPLFSYLISQKAQTGVLLLVFIVNSKRGKSWYLYPVVKWGRHGCIYIKGLWVSQMLIMHYVFTVATWCKFLIGPISYEM